MPINGLHLGDAETFGDIGSCVHLVPRSDGSKKENIQISTPLSVEININNNNAGVGPTFTDEVVITTGSGEQKKVGCDRCLRQYENCREARNRSNFWAYFYLAEIIWLIAD